VLILKAMNTCDALLSRACGLAWPFGPLLDALDLLPDAAVLDIGAGEGGLLENLRRRGHTGLLIGLDTKPGPGVQSGEAGALPFADAYFDAALMVRALLHVADPQRALAVAVQGAAHLAAFWARFGPPEAESADANTQQLLSSWPFERLDLVVPALLEPQMVRDLAASYGLPAAVSADLPGHLHLAVFRLSC